MNIRLNITDDQGTLLGQIELTDDELRRASDSMLGAFALVDEIMSEAGVKA